MSDLDNQFRPFGEYAGYLLMAPCMRDCDHYLEFNGCDNSKCWCKKNNLDRRVSSLERCASTSCTFADMNTATDVAIMSSIQLQYCMDRDLSPDGMTMPSTALAQPTDSSSSSESPLETGSSPTEGVFPGVTSGTESATRTRPSSGPADTGAPGSSTTSPSTPMPSDNSLSTAAKAGIAIGAVFCILLAVFIAILLFRRRKRPHPHPAPSYPPEYSSTPHMAPAPLHVQTGGSGGGVGAGAGFIPAPAPVRDDVSPMEEKTPAFTHTHEARPGVVRKDVGSPPPVPSPPVQAASPAPTEVAGSAPPDRHEVHGNAAVGGHPGGQGGRWVYEMQGVGVGREGAVELGGGR